MVHLQEMYTTAITSPKRINFVSQKRQPLTYFHKTGFYRLCRVFGSVCLSALYRAHLAFDLDFWEGSQWCLSDGLQSRGTWNPGRGMLQCREGAVQRSISSDVLSRAKMMEIDLGRHGRQ